MSFPGKAGNRPLGTARVRDLLFLAACWPYLCGGGRRGQRESLWKDSGTSASTSSPCDGCGGAPGQFENHLEYLLRDLCSRPPCRWNQAFTWERERSPGSNDICSRQRGGSKEPSLLPGSCTGSSRYPLTKQRDRALHLGGFRH